MNKLLFSLSAAVLLLSACAPQLRVTLLPQPDGSASAVTVQTAKASATINQHDWAGSRVS